ncbi:helix-turn-helix domain-containing protein [candidate division KSB1 bacterium]|nr:helix-turn-helix domain-containing protein [candidate division KSB1 bacterium]
MSKQNREMVSVKDAAEETELTPQLIRAYCRAGVFEGAEKIRGTRWMIPRKDLNDLLDDRLDLSGIFSK